MQVHKTTSLVFTIAPIFFLPLSAIAQPALIPSDRPSQLDCLVGYPDRSFRGDRALTRYEFAAGMAACLDPLNQQVNLLKTDASPKSDFKTILQTQQDLTDEIKRLQERLDKLR